VSFEFETELPVRFRDLDAMGHVNNAVYATYLEQARVDYFESVLEVPLSEIDSVLASLSIDYERPVRGGSVTVAVRVPEVGDSSVPMEYEVRDGDGDVAATGETVQVVVDPETGSPRPVPEEWRAAIEAFEGLD